MPRILKFYVHWWRPPISDCYLRAKHCIFCSHAQSHFVINFFNDFVKLTLILERIATADWILPKHCKRNRPQTVAYIFSAGASNLSNQYIPLLPENFPKDSDGRFLLERNYKIFRSLTKAD